jgi:hypothetical protein
MVEKGQRMEFDIDSLRATSPNLWVFFDECTRDFAEDECNDLMQSFEPSVEFPLPYMIYIVLVLLLQFRHKGREEKIAWTICFQFKSQHFAISYRKFGLRFFCSPEADEYVKKEIVVRLRKATEIADKIIEPIVKDRLNSGFFAIQNRSTLLFEKYTFFRGKTKEAFESEPPGPVTVKSGPGILVRSLDPFQPKREGFYYTQAMLDAFFSYLEHIMVLLLAFQGFDLNRDDIVSFMSDDWTKKYNRLFDPQKDSNFMRHYRKLEEVKERWRNTLAHGGFEKKGSSLYVAFPDCEYIPVTLSRYKHSVHFSMFPVEEKDYKWMCNVLDSFLGDLHSGTWKRKMDFIESGLDVFFNAEMIGAYKHALNSDEDMVSFIRAESEMWERNANMDW